MEPQPMAETLLHKRQAAASDAEMAIENAMAHIPNDMHSAKKVPFSLSFGFKYKIYAPKTILMIPEK